MTAHVAPKTIISISTTVGAEEHQKLSRLWIGGIASRQSVQNGKQFSFSMKSYLPGHSNRLHAIGIIQKAGTWGPCDLKPRDIECSSFAGEQLLQLQGRRVFSQQPYRWGKMNSLLRFKENVILRIAQSCFYVVCSSKYSRCEDFVVHLVGRGQWYLVWPLQTEQTILAARFRAQLMPLSGAQLENRPQ